MAKAEATKGLKRALVTPRTELLTQFNALPEGVKFLVDMRAELLSFAAKDPRFAHMPLHDCRARPTMRPAR